MDSNVALAKDGARVEFARDIFGVPGIGGVNFLGRHFREMEDVIRDVSPLNGEGDVFARCLLLIGFGAKSLSKESSLELNSGHGEEW